MYTFSLKTSAFLLLPLALLGAVHCNRDEDSERARPAVKAAGSALPAAAKSSTPQTKLDLGPIRPLPLAEEKAQPAVVPAAFKTFGVAGEQLEVDIYSFKALSFRTCGDTKESDARTVVGAEVEITAKTSMTISPRDVVLRSGGILFYANLDLGRKLPGCTPLLERPRLKAGQAAKGFVLFEVPSPRPAKLELTYQPTRWGGATPVRVELDKQQ